jgi:hypothetical protein
MDYQKLSKMWLIERETRQYEWNLDIVRNKKIELSDAGRIVFLESLINSIELVKLYRIYNDKGFDLFEKNVRGLRPGRFVESGISGTINANPELLHVFHNGLVIICKQIEKKAGGKYFIINPQIVNGLQTVTILSKLSERRGFKKCIKKSSIICKFYASESGKLIERICQASNTQIKIDPNDLRSNDDIQLAIEKYFELNNLKYIRKRDKRVRGVDKEKFAQWLYSCVREKPADAKNKKSLLFSVSNNGVYHELFNERLEPSELKRVYEIGKFVESEVASPKRKSERKFMRNANLHLMAGMYYLKNKKMTDLSKLAKVKRVTKKVLKVQIKTHGSDFNKIFAKDRQTWEKIKARL